MLNWNGHIERLSNILASLSVYDDNQNEVNPDSAFGEWKNRTILLREERKSVYLVGNGASASMASHMAADLTNREGVSAQVFTDMSLITAISNDLGYEHVFSEPLRQRMVPGEMLVAISSSGQSANVLNAVEVAVALGGYVVTLSGMDHNNPLRRLGHLNLYVPAETYGYAEAAHTAILHYWMDILEIDQITYMDFKKGVL